MAGEGGVVLRGTASGEAVEETGNAMNLQSAVTDMHRLAAPGSRVSMHGSIRIVDQIEELSPPEDLLARLPHCFYMHNARRYERRRRRRVKVEREAWTYTDPDAEFVDLLDTFASYVNVLYPPQRSGVHTCTECEQSIAGHMYEIMVVLVFIIFCHDAT